MDEQSTMYVIKYFNTGNLKEEVNWWLDGTVTVVRVLTRIGYQDSPKA